MELRIMFIRLLCVAICGTHGVRSQARGATLIGAMYTLQQTTQEVIGAVKQNLPRIELPVKGSLSEDDYQRVLLKITLRVSKSETMTTVMTMTVFSITVNDASNGLTSETSRSVVNTEVSVDLEEFGALNGILLAEGAASPPDKKLLDLYVREEDALLALSSSWEEWEKNLPKVQ